MSLICKVFYAKQFNASVEYFLIGKKWIFYKLNESRSFRGMDTFSIHNRNYSPRSMPIQKNIQTILKYKNNLQTYWLMDGGRVQRENKESVNIKSDCLIFVFNWISKPNRWQKKTIKLTITFSNLLLYEMHAKFK